LVFSFPDWSYRKKITVSNTNVDSDLTDFPLLVSATSTDLAAGANSDALDIFFTEETTCTKLKWEKESYTSGTGALVSWVKVPTVDADANTILYMYYGNSGASDQTDAPNVWDTNYKGVWHLSETPGGAGDILDSTTNINHGTTTGMTSGDQVAGQINGGLDFDAVGDRIEVTDSSSLDFGTGDFTLSLWILTTDLTEGQTLLQKRTGFKDKQVQIFHFETDGKMYFRVGDGGAKIDVISDTATPQDEWLFITAVRSGSSYKLYFNGKRKPKRTAIPAINSAWFFM